MYIDKKILPTLKKYMDDMNINDSDNVFYSRRITDEG